jgi:hypothetical protein
MSISPVDLKMGPGDLFTCSKAWLRKKIETKILRNMVTAKGKLTQH